MALDLKNIHIGSMIQSRVKQNEFEMTRICKFMQSSEEEIKIMYLQKDLPTNILLRWSKLLEYDFFRIYSQYLILFAPQKSVQVGIKQKEDKKCILPQFRKNLYTKEIIDFILELVRTGKRTKKQVMEEYNIPKSTLYKWLEKY
ncbi:helix-turn-helix domain-containing protein [Chryseobacterium sediminis]|jgi:hypothetical protein|uniref:helix-turn-helix domain-containing protein n=1 Tax=Chryseobacterium sediminis TaxID=1679494 RepID=UPI0028674D9E|nr:helix-turn-helix domain-containing protein [Chryseobacterium sediminis]MDR6463303.1 hypothetical protein [Chryseobacterium sediminis]